MMWKQEATELSWEVEGNSATAWVALRVRGPVFLGFVLFCFFACVLLRVTREQAVLFDFIFLDLKLISRQSHSNYLQV